MRRSLQRRLDALAKRIYSVEPRVRFVFQEEGDTDEQVEAKKRALIAIGVARPGDRIYAFRWAGTAREGAGN